MCGVSGLGGLATSKAGLGNLAFGVLGNQAIKAATKGKKSSSSQSQTYGDGTTDPTTGAMS